MKVSIMKSNRIYPAVFENEDNAFIVSFPDLPGCFTQGDTIFEAYKYAKEALTLYLDGIKKPPVPSDAAALKAPEGGYIMYVETGTDGEGVRSKAAQFPKQM